MTNRKTWDKWDAVIDSSSDTQKGIVQQTTGGDICNMSKKLSKLEQENTVANTEGSNCQLTKLETEASDTIKLKPDTTLPAPNIIAGYEEVLPGAANRTITLIEQESLHRQKIELLETKSEIRDSLLGVIFAFCLGIGCLVACAITVIMVPGGASTICGSILGVTGICSIVAAFLKNTRRSKK